MSCVTPYSRVASHSPSMQSMRRQSGPSWKSEVAAVGIHRLWRCRSTSHSLVLGAAPAFPRPPVRGRLRLHALSSPCPTSAPCASTLRPLRPCASALSPFRRVRLRPARLRRVRLRPQPAPLRSSAPRPNRPSTHGSRVHHVAHGNEAPLPAANAAILRCQSPVKVPRPGISRPRGT